MKVFIITEGGKDTGLGHMTRCCSLYDAFAQRGVTPTLLLNGNTAKGLLKNRRKIVFDWLRDNRKLFAMVRGADIAIIDSYLAPLSFYKKISGIVNIPVYLDVDVLAFVQGIAKKRKTEVSTTVNDLLRGHMRLVATTK